MRNKATGILVDGFFMTNIRREDWMIRGLFRFKGLANGKFVKVNKQY